MSSCGASTSIRCPSAEPVSAATNDSVPSVLFYGIRHHGPGSARAVRRALDADRPEIVLIEGPAEADAIAGLATDPQMCPPVTMLGYATDQLDRAVFYPYASFSPEWVALQWAGDHERPVRFIDLPLANVLADWTGQPPLAPVVGAERPTDPIALLADAAGYDDAERWWEDVVEHRDGTPPFDDIAEAMSVLRQAFEPDLVPLDPMERRREAQMRAGVRRAVTDGFTRIAVICGAWHVPALRSALSAGQAKIDAPLLQRLPKVKAAITWVPWTHRRLATGTGYAAGVTAPGWYHHLFTHPGPDTVARWFTSAARVLRTSDYSASAADVVEATRLATSLAALRNRPLAGLQEMNDASRAVLGDGTDTPMRLLSNELVIGSLIGRVPDRTPMVPLARNLAAEQRRCRLKPEGSPRSLELDLRRALDLSRSRLLHRLSVLGVDWGRETEGRGTAGTFRETWQLQWEPELEVRLIEMSALGTTVAAAAEAAVAQSALASESIADLAGAIEECLLADLTEPLPGIVALIAERAAVDVDIAHLMEALPTLARTRRYGDVRSTDATALTDVVRGLVSRISAGLVPACTSLDADAATTMSRLIGETQSALALLGDETMLPPFYASLVALVDRERVHPSLQGRATRLLADGDRIAADEVERRVSRALSAGTKPEDGAAFVEGFLGGSGTALVHDATLLELLDRWMSTLPGESFTEVLPLLRRTFGTFEHAERRQIGERLRTGTTPPAALGYAVLDPERVAAGLRTIALLLGAPQ